MKTPRFLIAVLILLSLVPQAFTMSPAINPTAPNSIQAHAPLKLISVTIINNTGRYIGISVDGVSKLGADKAYRFSGQATGKRVYKIEQGVYVVTIYGCNGDSAAKKFQMTGNRTITVKCGAHNDPTDRMALR